MKMGERSFETPNLGGDLWSMGFDVDLALDAHSNRKNNVSLNSVGGSSSSPIVNGSVNIGYGDMQHMLLHRFDDDLNDGDISQITDLTNSLPKGDSETAQSFLAKIACHDLARELGGAQGSTQKGIEASLFGSVNDGSTQGNNVLSHKPPSQPVDVYGRVTLYEGKLVLQLRHFNVNTNYPINVGECWLCREKMSNGSQIHSHKHVLQGLFQVNDEFVQMDIDHYIIPEQALEPDPTEVNRNLSSNNMITNSGPSTMAQHVTANRTLTLGEDIECSEALQSQHVNINAIGNSLHTPQRTLETSNESLQTPKGNSEIQYTETDLNNALSSAQQSLNSTVPIDSNTFLNSFTNNELRMASVAPSIVQTPNESSIMNHVTDTTSPSTSFPPPLSSCSITSNNNVTSAENMIPSNGTAESHSTLNEMENIQALCSSSNSITRNDGFIQHTTYEPNIGNKEQLDNYHNIFGHQYSYSYDNSTLNNHLSKFPVDSQSSSSSSQLCQSPPNPSPPNKPSIVNKRTEVGAKKRKSRAQKKSSNIRMRGEQDQPVETLLLIDKKADDHAKTSLEDCLKGTTPTQNLHSDENNKSENKTPAVVASGTNCSSELKTQCEMSSFSTPTSTLLSKKEFSINCPSCKLEYTNKNLAAFNTHIKGHKFEAFYTFQCPVCSKKISGSDKYVRHLKIHNGKRHFCSLCDANYSRPDKLRRHVANVHDSKKPFVCDICSKAFSRFDYLKGHKNIHLGKKFECEICHKLFSSQFNLKVHKKLHMDEKLPFPCDLCDKTYSRKDVLATHVAKDHQNKRFKCDVCSKLFSRNDVLKRHKVTHDDKRVTYDCEICGKKFHRKDRLKTHSNDHKHCKNDKTDASRFKNKEILLKQLKIQKHKEQCAICLKYLPSTLRLEKHLRWHETQIALKVNLEKEYLKNHKCEICAKSFKTKDLMKRHMLRIHYKVDETSKPEAIKDVVAKERKFFCEVCSKGFTRSYNLTTHLKTHSKKSSEDDKMLAELPTVLNASKSNSLKRRKKSYLILTKGTSCVNSSLDGTSKEQQQSPGTTSLHLPLEEGFVPTTSSHSPYNPHFPAHLSNELPIPTSSFCNSSPNSPINLSTEAISAAAYLLANPFYEGPYQ